MLDVAAGLVGGGVRGGAVSGLLVALLSGCGTLTGLPDVPATITAREAGLDSLPRLAEEARRLDIGHTARSAQPAGSAGARDPGTAGGVPEVKPTASSTSAGAASSTSAEANATNTGSHGTSAIEVSASTTSGRVSTTSGHVPTARKPDEIPSDDPLDRARLALQRIERGERAEGLAALAAALSIRPSDLVLGNAYRMAVYRLHRAAGEEARARGERAPRPPEFLHGEPLATLERLAKEAPGREIRLQVALAHVDRMVLEPALEIRAPASIDSVGVLTEILRGDPYYVPALVARGLNHLNRPRRIAWPEHPGPAPNAASLDFALAAAVGRKVGAAPQRLEVTVLTLLGDAYAHEEHAELARSWWGFARGRADGAGERDALQRRLAWPDAGMSDRLEQQLEERMADLDNPVSDLSFLWGAGRGPL